MNIRRSLIALALSIAAVSSLAETKAYRFADVPWHSSPSEVSKRLEAMGYSKLEQVQNPAFNVYMFSGKSGDDPFGGIAYFAPDDKLLKIALFFDETPVHARFRYEALKGSLTKKFGKPAVMNEYFDQPYHDGDEEQAFSVDKAHFISVYRGDPIADSATVAISEKGTQVTVSYEAADWPAEVERIKKQHNAGF